MSIDFVLIYFHVSTVATSAKNKKMKQPLQPITSKTYVFGHIYLPIFYDFCDVAQRLEYLYRHLHPVNDLKLT